MSTAPHPSPTPAVVPAPASAAEELQLLRQVAAGEPQAFDTLYQRYTPYLRRFLRRRLPYDLVDDVCHDTLLVAWKQAEHFQPHARLSTWLCGIARHRAQKAWQRVARQHAAPLPTFPAGDTVADPVVLLLHQEQHQYLARAVAQLPPDLRLVVEAAYYQAASYEAIATRLECPVATVQTRLVRARRQLRAALVRMSQVSSPCDADHRQSVTALTQACRPVGIHRVQTNGATASGPSPLAGEGRAGGVAALRCRCLTCTA